MDDLKWLILLFLRHSKQIFRNHLVYHERQVVSLQELQPGEAKSPGIMKILKTTRNISTAGDSNLTQRQGFATTHSHVTKEWHLKSKFSIKCNIQNRRYLCCMWLDFWKFRLHKYWSGL